jgi:hypothetical protein
MSYHCYGHDTQAYLVIKPIDNWITYLFLHSQSFVEEDT